MTNDAITEEMRLSLIEAGIGKRFHTRGLASVPEYGDALLRYLNTRGDEVRHGTLNIAWHGVGLTDGITMFSRALHLNGVGCYIRPLVRFRPIINDSEFKEIVNDIDVLVILNAQDTTRGCPLHDGIMSELEYVLRKRYDNRKATFLQLAVPEEQAIAELPNCYWSGEFLDMLGEGYERITPTLLKGIKV